MIKRHELQDKWDALIAQHRADGKIAKIPTEHENTNNKYDGYTCVSCGEFARNSYIEPIRSRMTANLECFYCDHARETEEWLDRNYNKVTIINGRIYTPGNRTEGAFRGMAGRRFDIEYTDKSKYAGTRITTYDLWGGSTLSDRLREKFPDTARFLNEKDEAYQAERKVNDITCFNSLRDNSKKPYPLPQAAGITPVGRD